MAELESLGILLTESAGMRGSRAVAPFLYELIRRQGDSGLGVRNFRALFESIEREQHAERRT